MEALAFIAGLASAGSPIAGGGCGVTFVYHALTRQWFHETGARASRLLSGENNDSIWIYRYYGIVSCYRRGGGGSNWPDGGTEGQGMKHKIVYWDTELKRGDEILCCDTWREIYTVSDDLGLNVAGIGWICRTKIQVDWPSPEYRRRTYYDRLLRYRNAYERMITTVPDYGPWCVYQMGLLSELMIDVRTGRQPLSEALPRLVA